MKNTSRWGSLLAVGLWVAVSIAPAAEQKTAVETKPATERSKADPLLPHIAILQAEKAPVVDGVLDDPCWAQAEESQVFTDEYSFPRLVKNTFKICQKDDVIYLAIRACYGEQGGKQSGGGVKHDGAIWNAENIEIFLDPDNADTPGYYQLVLTPFDITGDMYNNEPRDPEFRWEPKYEVKSKWSTNEWTIEYGIPLAAFDRTKTIYENFGMNVHRVGSGIGISAWSPGHSEGFHFPHKFGEARGLQGKLVTKNEPGLFRSPYIKVNDRVIKAKANPSLIPEKTPALVGKPKVKTSGGSVEIDFEVNTKTDVAVWIEDGKGERVRHLVAGMLGSNAPAPLKKDSLKQSLRWDSLDDFGKKVAPGAYKVKVGVGSKATLDKEIGRFDGPSQINGLAVDTKGFIYTIGGHLDQWSQIMKFDRGGKFVSMLMPPPADVPVEKLKGLNIIDFGPDGRATFGGNRLATTMPNLDQPMPHTLLVNSKGQVIFYGGEYQGGPTHLYKINADGSLPDDFLGPYIKDFNWLAYYEAYAKRFHFALDPLDEDMIYISGLKENHRGDEQAFELTPGNSETFYNAVYRIRWGKDAPLEVFAGKPNTHGTAGSDKPGEFYDPQGIAFDKDNNLWVCDRRNNRIQVLDRKGKLLRQIASASPYQVCLSRKTGEAYVMGGMFDQKPANPLATLTKYSAGTAPRALAQTNLPGAWNYWWSMALDESGSKPELVISWTGTKGENTTDAARHVMRVADLGAHFSEPEMIAGENYVDGYYRVTAGWDSDIVSAGSSWFDGNTGQLLTNHQYGTELAAARDGRWVVQGGFYPENLTVYPEAWATNAAIPALTNWFLDPPSLARNGRRGLCVAPNSDIYVARYYNWQYSYSLRGGEEGPDHHLAVDRYSMDGKLTGRRVVYELSGGAHSPVVDIKGNIYVCDNFGRKIGQFYEDDIAANMPAWAPDYHISEADWDTLRAGKELHAGYRKFVQNPLIKSVGSLYKFGPKGGGLLWRAGQGEYEVFLPEHDAKGQLNQASKYADWHYPAAPAPKRPATHWSSTWRTTCDGREGMYPAWLDGVEWEFLGVSHSSGRYSKGHDACICYSMRCCVDDFGRVYAPAAHRSTIRLIDTAGNELLRIGSYGNLDSGPGGRLQEPNIPLRYPTAAALSKRYLYLTESDIARVLRVKMGYQQEEACDAVVK